MEVSGGQQLGQHLGEQIESLLAGQPRDDTDDRRRRIGWQRQLVHQGLLVLLLAGEIETRKGKGDQRIYAWIPLLVLDTVENAGQVIAPRPQMLF